MLSNPSPHLPPQFSSQADYSDFCLSYRFTYRDFDNGVVGLAYIAPQPGMRVNGGVCENATSNPVATLNTGIVTSLNYARRIPPALSALTFAHEAGHNFGSQVHIVCVCINIPFFPFIHMRGEASIFIKFQSLLL